MPPAFSPAAARISLFDALVRAARTRGWQAQALEDHERTPLTYDRLLISALLLGRKLGAFSERGERVGVLLPNTQAVAVTLFGLLARGRVPAMLNFTAGEKALREACDTAGLSTVVTARRFVDQAQLGEVVAALGQGRRIVHLDDVRAGVTGLDKARALAESRIARIDRRPRADPDDPAVVLFTSGTEGVPKGVVLTHANLVSNAMQIGAHASGALQPSDILFNPLPVFHAFGLTAGLLVGLLNGMKVVLYPSPLHYRQVPKLVRETGATILFSTDTFAQGYARAAEPGDLAGVRHVIAGAERVKESTRRTWSGFGTVVLEGYGVTECGPVIACNLPESDRPGTAGRMLPGIEARLEPFGDREVGGRLFVRGPNVMAGYLLADRPGEVVGAPGGWHDTGDVVEIDREGFVTITGRAKRFAKIGGEMVSLAAVEEMAADLWPEHRHVVVALPDPRRGEALILVTEEPQAARDPLLAHAKAQGVPELWVPKVVHQVAALPVLASGKVDLMRAVELAREARSAL